MTDLHGTDANGRSLANGMILMGLLEWLRDHDRITNADIRTILDKADVTLSARPNDSPVQSARRTLELMAGRFREAGV